MNHQAVVAFDEETSTHCWDCVCGASDSYFTDYDTADQSATAHDAGEPTQEDQ